MYMSESLTSVQLSKISAFFITISVFKIYIYNNGVNDKSNDS